MVAVLSGLVGGCGASSSGTGGKDTAQAAPSTAADLATGLYDSDKQEGLASSDPAAYATAFAALLPRCQESQDLVAQYVSNTLGVLQKSHITDETRLTVMRHLTDSIPASAGPMKCLQVAAAYATLRQTKQ